MYFQRKTSPTTSGRRQPASPKGPQEAVLTISVYDRLSWGNYLSRSSQHVILSSQTISSLCDAMICPSDEIPEELTGTYPEGQRKERASLVCIEGVVYGDDQDGRNSAEYVKASFKYQICH